MVGGRTPSGGHTRSGKKHYIKKKEDYPCIEEVDMEDRERLRIVLRHLIEHNEGHVEDYTRWIELAQTSGLDAVAVLIEEANEHSRKAGAALKKAVELIIE
jgi:hypothetical protein